MPELSALIAFSPPEKRRIFDFQLSALSFSCLDLSASIAFSSYRFICFHASPSHLPNFSVCVCPCGSARPVECLPYETRSRFNRGEAYSSGVAIFFSFNLFSAVSALSAMNLSFQPSALSFSCLDLSASIAISSYRFICFHASPSHLPTFPTSLSVSVRVCLCGSVANFLSALIISLRS